MVIYDIINTIVGDNMDNENNTNPFEETNSNSEFSEENQSEFVDFGTLSANDTERDFYNNDFNDASTINNFDNNNYNQQDMSYNQIDYEQQDEPFNRRNNTNNNQSFAKKIPIIIGIIVLLVLLVIALKSLLGVEEPLEDVNDNTPVEVDENDESILNKRFSLDSTKLANGNILVEIKNKNKISVDATITVEYFNSDGASINNEELNVKNIPAKSTYYESIPVKTELKEMEFEVDAKLTANKFKEYYLDKIDILNKKEEEENLLIEVKNDSYSTIDVIEVYALYYDAENNIIGVESSSINKLAPDKTSEIKIGYPKDKEYHFQSFSKYEVGINTAYSYKNN